jgi:DNA-directed RNA polymerase sigma subunit (sigma70/sigma32)
LFDTLVADAFSQIATLTGNRRDGLDTHLDLEKALAKIPTNEQQVFEALYLENGGLLDRPRTYGEAGFLTGPSTQQVRTLERKAIEKLRPALSPAFFKRRK